MRARNLAACLLSTTMLTLPVLAHAQTKQSRTEDTTEVIVTAQKRTEKLTSVPISIQVLGTKKLDQLNVGGIDDYVALLPSVSYQNNPYQGSSVYFRGVASGGDGNHSGSQPSAGIYLDEQPVTTIGGPLDVHIYDVARIESLSGPQGTLYGASSEAGTIRIITNKPDNTSTYGRFDAEGNGVAHGGYGGKIEGMFNTPIGQRMALRVVGWAEHSAGYIDNVPGSRTFTGLSDGNGGFLPGITVDNSKYVEKNYNDRDVAGGRAALKIDLDENWTATASLMGQDSKAHGSAGYDPSVGDLKVQHFFPEMNHDRFYQAALTLQGKLGIFDVTYAGDWMERKLDTQADYTDYAEAYDQNYAYYGGVANYFAFLDDNGNTINSSQTIIGKDKFTKESHELRIASPSDKPLRFVGGVFFQRQTHHIFQDYQVPGLAAGESVNGHPGTLWLTDQMRVDRDAAVFGELSYDITPTLTVTAGGRSFTYDNTLIGFFGFGGPDNAAFGSSGVRRCFTTDTYNVVNPVDPTGTLLPAAMANTPCTNLGVQNSDNTISPKRAKGSGFSPKLNLTWKATPDLMVYTTWSKGFRPGGINRRGTVPPYQPDYLVNTELGWKATLFDKRVRFNGAVYSQEWQKFQYSYLGANSFTEVHNGPDARIDGVEADLTWAVSNHLTITANGAYTDARIKQNLCAFEGDTQADCSGTVDTVQTKYPGGVATPTVTHNQDFIAAPKGTRLPITPRYKASIVARYSWEMGKYTPFWQIESAYQSSASTDIRTAAIETGTFAIVNPAALLGRLKAYTITNISIGANWDDWTAELYVRNLTDERAQLARYQECGSCYVRSYIVTNTPRTVGVRLGTKF